MNRCTLFTAPQKTWHALLSVLFLTTLVACGGGSSSTPNITQGPGNEVTENPPPTVYAGEDQLKTEGASVLLTGSASDEGGAITSREWSQTAGPAVTLTFIDDNSRSFTIPPTTEDTVLSFKFTAIDNLNASASDNVDIIVQDINEPPLADAGTNTTVNEFDLVTLDASASSDEDGDKLEFHWAQIDGPTATLENENNVEASFTAPLKTRDVAQLTFQVTVTDDDGDSDTAEVVITVNGLPIADAGEDQQTVEQRLITLDGTSSQDSDMNDGIKSYHWIQTAGPTVDLADHQSALTTFTAPAISKPQRLSFQLTVTDYDDAAQSDDVVVAVVLDRPLNDTGLLVSGDLTSGNDTACNSDHQDCAFGLDRVNNNDLNGHGGFSFTKLGIAGEEGPADTDDFHCVRDNITGLVWESKSNDVLDPHYAGATYRWGGLTASTPGNIRYSDWDDLVIKESNGAALCGFTDWRVPTVKELETLLDFSGVTESKLSSIDAIFFPYTANSAYWTATSGHNMGQAWAVHFRDASTQLLDRETAIPVRLVRGGK